MIRRPWVMNEMPQIGVTYLILKEGPRSAAVIQERLSFWKRVWTYLNKDIWEVWTDIKRFWRI